MKWTQDKIDEAIDVLKESSSLDEAVQVLSLMWHDDITKGALRKALKRRGCATPSYYLNDVCEEEVSLDSFEEELQYLQDVSNSDNLDSYPEPNNAWIDTDFEKQVYKFKHQFNNIEVTFEEMSDILIHYSDVAPGQGWTKQEIASHYQLKGKSWASVDFLKWMLKTIGFTKSKFPCPPHDLFQSHQQILSSAYDRKDALIRGERNESIVKKQNKLIESLYEELNDITRAISTDGKTLEESEIRQLDLTGGNCSFRDGHRVAFISINDLHNGKKVEDLPHSKDANIFNEDVFWERVKNTCVAIDQFGNSVNFDKVYVAGLGDYFEALLMNMRPHQWSDAYNYGQEQYKSVKEAWIKIVQSTLDSFSGTDVQVVIQGGNHDRLTKDGAAGSEEVLAFQLCENIKDRFVGEDRVDISFGAAVVSTMLENGVNLIHFHGHKSTLKCGKDFDSFIRMHGFDHAKRYVIVQGHWHTFKVLTGHKFRAVWMPAFCGEDRYSREVLLKGGAPEIAFLDICGHHDKIVGPFNLHYNLDGSL